VDRGEKIRRAHIESIQLKDPTLSDIEADKVYRQQMRERGSAGGKKGGRPFRDVPGLAQEASLKGVESRRQNADRKTMP